MNNEYNTVVLAGLLHDIGKFYQKGQSKCFNTDGKHPEVSLNFINKFERLFNKFTDIDLLRQLVQKHHENARSFSDEMLVQKAPQQYKKLAYLLSCADNFSSKERDEESESKKNFRTRPMASIFSSITLDDSQEPKTVYYRPNTFEPEHCFPDPDMVQNIVSKNTVFIDRFTDEMGVMAGQEITNFNTLYTVINSLLLKYLWCIPSSSFDRVPDVSLYDHLKTTSAIAACLYKYHDKINDFTIKNIKDDTVPKFKMVVGDFSGIQKFIFDVSSAGAGGIAKRLRARSFYVNALLEIVSHYICHVFDVPLNNILISAGGKCYILLPNTPNSEEILNNIVKEVEEYLYKESAAEISINIATQEISGASFERFEDVIQDLNQKLQYSKNNQFEKVLKKQGKWNEDKFIVFKDLDNKTPCKCCNKVMVSSNSDRICPRCSADEELGQRLSNARYIYYGKNIKGMRIFKDYYISVEKELADVECYLVNMLNRSQMDTYCQPLNIKYMANHIPVYKGQEDITVSDNEVYAMNQPLTFQAIASTATGKKMLGIYKADVDNLGFLFMEGLKRDEGRSKNTVSRITTFSRMLEMFFSGYLNKLIHEKYPYTYCIFSGGDDLFLIGAWDKMIDMAIEINTEFKRYTASNPWFSLSAAVVPQKPKYPINKAAEEAEEQLEMAKHAIKFYNQPKNQVVFLGDNMKWDDFEQFVKRGQYIQDLISKDVIGVGQIRRLINYCFMYRDFLENRSIHGLRFLPMLSYDIARNYSERTNEEKRFKNWVLNMRKEISHNKEFYFLNVIANYALMKTRQEGI